MAFDQTTRTRLQKFVSESRAVLTEEFTRQLQSTYGMDPKTGTIADLETLTFLDNQGKQTALLLRETLAHYLTTIQGKSQKERTCQALNRIIREQAFTVLNRLGALRMAESRGFLIESEVDPMSRPILIFFKLHFSGISSRYPSLPDCSCHFIRSCYYPAAGPEDRAMLGSNPSAVAGDEDMGAVCNQLYAALFPCFCP